jgi:hypothetical protein
MKYWGGSDALASAVLTSLGALIAAWVGTQLGLRKFRSERAFDARVEWHRELAETARVLRNRTKALVAFQRGGTPEEIAVPLLQELSELAFAFQELSEQASLYASKPTYLAIKEVLVEMTRGSRAFTTYPAEQDSVSPQDVQRLFTSSIDGFERVYDLLARDLRKLYGLEPL